MGANKEKVWPSMRPGEITFEHAEHNDQCHGGNGNARHRDETDDVDGVRALLGEQVATGYEEGKIHFFRSSSMCSI